MQRLFILLFFSLFLFACVGSDYDGDVVPVADVSDIQVSLVDSNPPLLFIKVTGIVPSEGWSEPQLIPFQYFAPPQNGMYDFTFMAKSPLGFAEDKQTSITAQTTMIAEGVNGVIIHSEGEPKTYLITGPLTSLSLVMEVLSIQVVQSEIIVSGNVRTTGWTNPQLVLRSQENGTFVYDFVAQAPEGQAGQAITPIVARAPAPERYSSIQVNSATHSLSYP